jgi:hypothetical protein
MESQMKRPLHPTSAVIRSVFAAAVLATLITATSIDGLVDHYHAGAQIGHASSVVVAGR